MRFPDSINLRMTFFKYSGSGSGTFIPKVDLETGKLDVDCRGERSAESRLESAGELAALDEADPPLETFLISSFRVYKC